MTQPPPVVSVRGEATLEVDPDIAVLSISLNVRERDREETLRVMGEQGRALAEIADRFGAGIEKFETGDLGVYPEMREGSLDRVAFYVGHTTLTITVVDFAVLSDLIVAAGELPLVQVYGPQWQLRPSSPWRREARTAATTDAIRRAREYAEAFGCQLIGLLEVSDSGMTDGSQVGMTHEGRMSMSKMDSGQAALDLQPVKQQVYGSIEARFSMSAPPNIDRLGT